MKNHSGSAPRPSGGKKLTDPKIDRLISLPVIRFRIRIVSQPMMSLSVWPDAAHSRPLVIRTLTGMGF